MPSTTNGAMLQRGAANRGKWRDPLTRALLCVRLVGGSGGGRAELKMCRARFACRCGAAAAGRCLRCTRRDLLTSR
eukprot:5120855-Pyramimonas_sp.AAC.1